MKMLHGTIIVALFAYLFAAGSFLMLLRKGGDGNTRISVALFRVGLIAHVLSAGILVASLGAEAVRNGGDYYFWVSLVIAVLVVAAGKRIAFPSLGAMLSGVTALFLVSSSILAHRKGEELQGGAALLICHVIPAMIAEALLVFAAVASLLFITQERRIKGKKVDGVMLKGPSLVTLERWAENTLLLAFIAMGVAVISGILWAFGVNRPLMTGDPLQWGAIASWLFMALVLHARRYLGCSMRRFALLTVVAVTIFYGSVVFVILSSGSLFHGR